MRNRSEKRPSITNFWAYLPLVVQTMLINIVSYQKYAAIKEIRIKHGNCKFGDECNLKHLNDCCSNLYYENHIFKIKVSELTNIVEE